MPDDHDPRWDGSGSYLDWLMHMDPLELSAQNLDQIIAYQRKAQAASEAGIKPKRGVAISIDLASIGLGPKTTVKKRKL